MKKTAVLFLFLFGLFKVNAQENNTQNINLSVNRFANQMSQGVYDNKDGTITVVEVGGSGFVSLNRLRKRAQKSIIEYTTRHNLKYKYLTETTRKMTVGVFPKVARIYQVLNQNGSVLISKSIAISKIKEFKELLDMGVITKKEFDNSTKKYKKVLLDD